MLFVQVPFRELLEGAVRPVTEKEDGKNDDDGKRQGHHKEVKATRIFAWPPHFSDSSEDPLLFVLTREFLPPKLD